MNLCATAQLGGLIVLSNNDFSKKQIIIVFFNKGEKLSFQNDNILIRTSDDKIIHQSTCYRLFAVFVVGNITITSGLIQRAKKFEFSIILMTTSMRTYQIIGATKEGNTLLRAKQHSYLSLDVAKHIAKNKMSNQRILLNAQRQKNDELKQAIIAIDDYIIKIDTSLSISDIMGYEGAASRVYFKNHFNNVVWKGRKPRIKNDMTNALLDIGYTLLFSFVEAMLEIYGFDLYVGVLHRAFYMRKSLVCDLVEPFRCLIDDCVKKGINLGQFKEKDFVVENLRYDLAWKKSPDYVSVLMQPLLDNKTEIFQYIQSYYRAFMKQLEESEYPNFTIR